MSFDIDPANERSQLDHCIEEIKALQLRIKRLEKVAEIAKFIVGGKNTEYGAIFDAFEDLRGVLKELEK